MNESAEQFWRRCLEPKIRLGHPAGLSVTWQMARIRGRREVLHPRRPLTLTPHEQQWACLSNPPMPWIWIGATHVVKRRLRPALPEALIRAPGEHLFPAPRHQQIAAHRLVWHLLIAPIGDGQVRYRGPAMDRPNVNPDFYEFQPNSRAYRYEPPTLEDFGGRSEDEDLIVFILGGGDPSLDWTAEEIARAQATIESRKCSD